MAMWWGVFESEKEIHISPVTSDRISTHKLSERCDCHPREVVLDDGGVMYVHHEEA